MNENELNKFLTIVSEVSSFVGHPVNYYKIWNPSVNMIMFDIILFKFENFSISLTSHGIIHVFFQTIMLESLNIFHVLSEF